VAVTPIRRSRVEIWRDILEAVRNANDKQDLVPPSRIQCTANVPHDRFWRHVEEMERRGLVQSEPLRATKEGERFLLQTGSLRDLLDQPYKTN
jgi:predicted transcriptional regulator